MSEARKTLIGVYKADGGLLGEISYFFGHLVGVRSCSLCDITHSPVKKKNAFKIFEKKLSDKHGIDLKLVHMNERTEEELAASEGREPCVLLQYEDGSISMFLDFVELKAAGGSVQSFEKLVESRLAIYL
jgi:hypothetical protein